MKLTGTEFCVFKGDFSQSLIEAKKYKKEQNYQITDSLQITVWHIFKQF